jgi:hypothetical protein
MAIGSDPEIGVVFKMFGQMTREEQDEWFAWLRTAPPVGTLVEERPIIKENNDK